MPLYQDREALRDDYDSCYTVYTALYARLISEKQRFSRLLKERAAKDLEDGEEDDDGDEGSSGAMSDEANAHSKVQSLKEQHDSLRERLLLIRKKFNEQ
jgi:hypothetical protein